MFLTLQNLAEFWNVCTRPVEVNGLGLSPEFTDRHVTRLLRLFVMLPESATVIQEWRDLVRTLGVRGVQVHDARLAAFLKAYSINKILTFNSRDFTRYPHVSAIHPDIL